MELFTVREIRTGGGTLQYRRETLTGFQCRISSERIKRGIDHPSSVLYPPDGCPFCRDAVMTATPVFAGGSRILRGESVTFPNLYPFAAWHTVTVITRDHDVPAFTPRQVADALSAQVESLAGQDGYPSINGNYLPSAGASLAHPHLQGLVDREPSALAERYIQGSENYRSCRGRRYGDDLREKEAGGPRYLFGDEILWLAHAVPLGEKEIRAILPVSRLDEFGEYLEPFARDLCRVLDFYRRLGTSAFNLAIFFDRPGHDHGFAAFASLIARINPNPACISDTAFMERLHLEPLILTAPEDLARTFREIES